jgi:tetratricopeptide (TPR) repeat protein/predicted Ser/Thr protein kinase
MGTARKIPAVSPFPEDLTGCKVGRFVVKKRLGAGGMGEVYSAEDTKLRRPVALKRVARRLGNNPAARIQILQEAQRASALTSEHIASVHDVVEENGELFIVMEYVEGETLRKRLDRPIALKEFFAIATQCAEALTVAHSHDIVHCDIKPENILITGENKAKILDFGVARRCRPTTEGSTLGESTIDPSGLTGGTPGYMAPEVLLERVPDARSDIFSLGVVLYEILTGQRPFFAGSFVASSERVLHERPAAIRELRPDVPESVASIVTKAMAKAPEQRYASASELLDDLQRAATGTTPQASTEALRVRHRRVVRRWAVASVAVLLAIGLVALLRWKTAPPVLAERGWVLITDFDSGDDGTVPATAVREGLTIALEQSRYVNVFPRSRVYEVLQRMRKPGARIDEALGREICQRENLAILLVGSVDHSGQTFQIAVRGVDPVHGNLLFAERERFDGENKFFEKTDALASNVRRDLGESLEHIQKGTRPLARVTTSSLEALQLYSRAKEAVEQGKNEPVAELLKSALRLDPGFAMAHLELGQYYLAVVEKNDKAVAEHERAYLLRENVTDRERRRIEALYYGILEQYEDEQQALEALLRLYPDDEEAHEELARAYYDLNEVDRAIPELRQVLRLNPSSARGYGDLVLFLAYGSQSQAAVTAFHEAQNHGVETPRMHWGVGLAYLGLEDVPQAQREFEQIGRSTETDRQLRDLCLAIVDLYRGQLNSAKAKLTQQARAVPPEAGGLQIFTRYLLGRIYLAQGDRQAAAREADLILRVPLSGLQVTDLRNAGILYARSGEIDKAEQVARQIDDLAKKLPSSSNRSGLHNLEGEIFLAQGKAPEAENEFVAAAQDVAKPLTHMGLARAYEMEGQWEAASREWEQVVSSYGQVLHNDFAPDLAYAELQLGRLYRRMNNPALARSHYERFLKRWQEADDAKLLARATREFTGLT